MNRCLLILLVALFSDSIAMGADRPATRPVPLPPPLAAIVDQMEKSLHRVSTIQYDFIERVEDAEAAPTVKIGKVKRKGVFEFVEFEFFRENESGRSRLAFSTKYFLGPNSFGQVNDTGTAIEFRHDSPERMSVIASHYLAEARGQRPEKIAFASEEASFSAVLRKWIRMNRKWEIKEEIDPANHAKLLRLDLHPADQFEMGRTYWIAPNKGHAMVRFKEELRMGRMTREIECKVEDLGGGNWFPTHIVERRANEFLGIEKIEDRRTITILNAKIVPDFPENQFTIESLALPPGTFPMVVEPSAAHEK